MGLVSDIAVAAGVELCCRGDSELVPFTELVRFLEAVRDHNLCILGLEGFRLVEGRLVPDMDAILDVSSMLDSADSEETVAEALAFLSSLERSDLFYDVTLSDCR